MTSPAYHGKSHAIHVGSSGAAVSKFGAHGWRLSVTGSQVVGPGASATVDFSTDVIADTDGYWNAADSTHVTVPLCWSGVYLLAADAFVPGYNAGLTFEVVVDSGDGEDPTILGTDVHTAPPKAEAPLSGLYGLASSAVVHLVVTNTTGGSLTLSKGSFTGVLLLPTPPRLPVDDPVAPTIVHQQSLRGNSPAALDFTPSAGNLILVAAYHRGGNVLAPSGGSGTGWTTIKASGGAGPQPTIYGGVYAKIATGTETAIEIAAPSNVDLRVMWWEINGAGIANIQNLVAHEGDTYPDVLLRGATAYGPFGPGTIVQQSVNNLFFMGACANCDGCGIGPAFHDVTAGWTVDFNDPGNSAPMSMFAHRLSAGNESPQWEFSVAAGNPSFLYAEAWGVSISSSASVGPSPNGPDPCPG